MFARKDYTFQELLAVFSADLIDFIYRQKNTTNRFAFRSNQKSTPTLNFLIIFIPYFNLYKIFYFDNCPLWAKD